MVCGVYMSSTSINELLCQTSLTIYSGIALKPKSHFMEIKPIAASAAPNYSQDESTRNFPPRIIRVALTNIYHRASHQAHIAIAKALFTPIAAMISFVFGHILHRITTHKDEYRAPLFTSALAGFIGGHCLVGSVVILNIVIDTRPNHGTKWHRDFTSPAVFIICIASVGAGPLGVMITNVKGRLNPDILDPYHAFSATSLGASLICLFLLIGKFISHGTLAASHPSSAHEAILKT